MPLRQLTRYRSKEHDALVAELVKEWNPQSSNAEPVILVEPGPDGKPAHVYVVWDEWANVDRVERSEIVMEAANQKLNRAELDNITIAMGLTADEAKRLGLKY